MIRHCLHVDSALCSLKCTPGVLVRYVSLGLLKCLEKIIFYQDNHRLYMQKYIRPNQVNYVVPQNA